MANKLNSIKYIFLEDEKIKSINFSPVFVSAMALQIILSKKQKYCDEHIHENDFILFMGEYLQNILLSDRKMNFLRGKSEIKKEKYCIFTNLSWENLF